MEEDYRYRDNLQFPYVDDDGNDTIMDEHEIVEFLLYSAADDYIPEVIEQLGFI